MFLCSFVLCESVGVLIWALLGLNNVLFLVVFGFLLMFRTCLEGLVLLVLHGESLWITSGGINLVLGRGMALSRCVVSDDVLFEADVLLTCGSVGTLLMGKILLLSGVPVVMPGSLFWFVVGLYMGCGGLCLDVKSAFLV